MTNNLIEYFEKELTQLDDLSQSKRHERVITELKSPTKAVINDKTITLFNTNDYLGLRLHPDVIKADHEGVNKFGAGSGSVRFISGTTVLYKTLESKIASFHGHEDAILFSSAFMANLAVMSVITKDREPNECLLLTDEMNHRSIIDGIKLASKEKEDKIIYPHLDYAALEQILEDSLQKHYQRVVIVTDGVFSMLGDYADLKRLNSIKQKYQDKFPEGIMLVVDDCHGVGVIGEQGRGVESIFNEKADLLVGTLGKAFGSDGGYIVGGATVIKYLREKAASYIFSNSFSPGSASAAIESINILNSARGTSLLDKLNNNIKLFKSYSLTKGLPVFSKLDHPIQPFIVGESEKTLAISNQLFEQSGYFVTPITFPAVAKGKEELRIQINASHEESDIKGLIDSLAKI